LRSYWTWLSRWLSFLLISTLLQLVFVLTRVVFRIRIALGYGSTWLLNARVPCIATVSRISDSGSIIHLLFPSISFLILLHGRCLILLWWGLISLLLSLILLLLKRGPSIEVNLRSHLTIVQTCRHTLTWEFV
jgi:hypothetical protein